MTARPGSRPCRAKAPTRTPGPRGRRRVAHHHHLERPRRRLGDGPARRAALSADAGQRRASAKWPSARGVNIVMYALTGNYKADQVHVPGPPRTAGAVSMSLEPGRPPLPLAVLISAGFGRRGVRPSSRSASLRQRGSVLRALGLAFFSPRLLNPSFVREDREPLKDVVAVVLDRSRLQTLEDARRRPTPARAATSRSASRAARRRDAHRSTAAKPPGQRRHRALLRAPVAASPTCRPSASAARIMITDGVVHDVPRQRRRARLQGAAACPLTGHEGERDRRIGSRQRRASASSARTRRSACACSTTGDRREPVPRHACGRDGSRCCERARACPGAAAAPARAHRPWRPERRRVRGRRRSPAN